MSSPFASKFVRLLKTFDESTLKSFEIWLKSPWCNSNKNLIRLLQQLKKYYPNFAKRPLTKEKLFNKILPEGKYSTRRMNNLLSEAYQAAEKFLYFHHFSTHTSLQTDLLTREWQARQLNDWFFRDIQQGIERLEALPVKTWEAHLTLLRHYRKVYHYPDQNIRLQQGLTPLLKIEEHLDLSYLLEKAAIINEKIFRNRLIKNEQHDVKLDLEVWQMASRDYQHPALELYRMRFDYTPENMLTQYQEIKKYFTSKLGQLNEKEQKTHLLSLLNDSTLLIKQGLIDITQMLPLYQLGLSTGVLINQGRISLSTYTTIVVASNTKGSFDFTVQFIQEYSDLLKKNIREDSINWAWAHTAYWKKDLNTSLTILLHTDFKATYFQYICRVLNTQVYFDLYLDDDSYQMYLFNYFDTFEKWLTREKKWSESQKQGFLTFVQKTRQLARYYSEVEFSTSKVETFLDNITNIQALNWLEKKKEEVLQLRTKQHRSRNEV